MMDKNRVPVDVLSFERAEHTQTRYGREMRQRLARQAGLAARLEAFFAQRGDSEPVENTLQEDRNWRQAAVCAQIDPEIFFPEKGGSTREAKKICNSCEDKAACLDFALANDETFGVRGSLSAVERRQLIKQQRPPAKRAARTSKKQAAEDFPRAVAS